MSKYIIELGEDANMVQVISVTPGGNAYIDSTVYVGYLEQLNSDYINENFGELQDEAYQRGFEDGKAVHEKGCEGCKYEGNPNDNPCKCCSNGYPNQWAAKDDKIKVGDEVTHKSDSVKWTAIVTRISYGTLTLMEYSGAIADNYPIEDFVKTGRHFDIASILEAMKA